MTVTLAALLVVMLQFLYAGEQHLTCFQTIEAVEGEDVTPRWRLDPPVNSSACTLDVARAHLGIHGDVCSRRRGKERVDRCRGVAALLSDGGKYKVFLQNLRARSADNVAAESKDHQNRTKTGPPGEEVTDANNRGGGDGKAARGRIVPAVVLLLGFVIALVVLVNTRNNASTVAQNFAQTLPTEMMVKIFSELDAESLYSASRTCRLWHDIIEESEQVTLVKNYRRSCVKRDWLRGRYSHVRSAEELNGRKMAPLDAETWGEILQAELDR